MNGHPVDWYPTHALRSGAPGTRGTRSGSGPAPAGGGPDPGPPWLRPCRRLVRGPRPGVDTPGSWAGAESAARRVLRACRVCLALRMRRIRRPGAPRWPRWPGRGRAVRGPGPGWPSRHRFRVPRGRGENGPGPRPGRPGGAPRYRPGTRPTGGPCGREWLWPLEAGVQRAGCPRRSAGSGRGPAPCRPRTSAAFRSSRPVVRPRVPGAAKPPCPRRPEPLRPHPASPDPGSGAAPTVRVPVR